MYLAPDVDDRARCNGGPFLDVYVRSLFPRQLSGSRVVQVPAENEFTAVTERVKACAVRG